MKSRALAMSCVTLALVFCLSAAWAVAGEDVRAVQQALLDKGYNPGPIDGIMGGKTRAAIRDFQRDQNLPDTGRLDEETQRALGVSVSNTVTVPAGTRVDVLLNDALSSQTANVGDRFSLTVASAAVSGALPKGAVIYGRVKEVERAKRPEKGGKLTLEAESLVLEGETYPLAGVVTAGKGELKGKGSLKEDWKKIAIGAGVGAVVGGIAGGGKGVAAGLAIGGGGTFLATKGEEVKLPPEARLVVELSQSVEVRAW